MVRSANLFCFRQKTLTNKQQSLGVDFLQRNNCCICYFVRGRPAPVHFIKLRGERRQQEDIFAHRQSSIWEEEEMKINFLSVTIYLTLSSSDSGVHLSRLPQQQDLCCRGADRFLQRHRFEPLSMLMSWLFWRS